MASGAAGLIQQIQIDDGGKHNFASTAYGICNTEANNANKVVEMTGFTLIEGTTVHIKFTHNNTVANPTLNINGTGAKPIVQYGTIAAGTASETTGWQAGAVVSLTYDGTSWVRDQGFNSNSTYSYMRPYGSTAGATAAKTGTAGWKFQLTAGKYFMFTQYYDNTAQSALTLNIGSTGAKPIYINGQPSSADNYTLPGGQYLVYYDGTNYHFRTDDKIPGNISGDAQTVNGLTVQTAVPANAKFTDTNKYHKSGSWSGLTYTATAVNGADELKFTIPDNYGDTKNPYASKTKNYVLAAPSNANGAPSFRALVAVDIPDLSGTYVKKVTSTDNAIARFDGTGGAIQNSSVKIDDNGHIIVGAAQSIYQNQADTSNYTTIATWLKNSKGWIKEETTYYTYQPQIGQHNTGGDGTGSITILPYPTDNAPWGGSVGLFIRKGQISLDNNRIPNTGNTTGSVGGTTTPVYVDAGIIKPVTLKDTANALINALDTGSSTLTANDYVITQYVGGSTTTTTYHRRPASQVVNGTLVKAALGTVGTTAKKFLKDTGAWAQVAFSDLSGTATNAQLANSKVTIAGNDVSLGGSLTAATLTSSLGLSNALHFIGITSTTLTDGSTTATLTAKSTDSLSKTTGFVDGDVVMDGDQLREYVWSGNAWRLLGITTSTKYEKTTSGNTFISKVTQATDGTVTAESRELNTSGTWSGTATKASYPEGFSSRSTNATWGNQTGATVTCWNESDGGSIDIRKNNPSSGKVSIKVDGRFYGNEGTNPAMLMSDPNNTSYWGMGSPDGANNVWIRTTSLGIIPFQAGGASAGHCGIGTSSWYFGSSYIQDMYGTHRGNVVTSSITHTDGDNIDNGSWITGNTGVAPTATTTDGTTTYSGATIGTSILTLGNNKIGGNSANGVANNSQGFLRLYSSGSAFAQITAYSGDKTRLYPEEGISIPTDKIGIMFRPTSGSYYTHFSYQTGNNEALVMATQNAVTSFIFINGESYANVSSTRWRSLTPALQIKNNSVIIGKLIDTGVTPSYKFEVKGNSFFDGRIIGTLSPSSWIDGQRHQNGAYNINDYSNTGSYNPWMRATNTWASGAENAKVGRWFSFGTLGTSFYWMGSVTTRTENSYDNALRYDTSNGYLYASAFKGNATSADSARWLMNRGGSTVTISDGPWAHGQTGSGGTNAATVWHQRWKQSGLTYTPSGGSATALTDSGDMVLWLAQSATSNALTVNMAIDGIIYASGGFKGNLNGQANTVARATFGDSGNGEHNANNIKSNGMWYYTSNGPATTLGASTGDGAIYSQAYSTSWAGQIAQDYRDGALFVRGLSSGTWKNWYAIPKFTTTTGGLGSTTQPVYIDANGEIQEGTVLKDLAYIAKPTSNTTTTFLRGDGTWQTALTSHRTYTAVSGKKPTGNQTPGFGGTFDIEQVGQDTTGQISVTERTVKIPDTAASVSTAGLVNTDAQTFAGVKTFDNGIHIYGTISTQGTSSIAGTMMPGGAYHSGYNSIVLHGDTAGVSGIGFTSEKATKSGTTTNINGSSDRAFIQYHAYGVTPAAEGTAPTLATTGEAGTFVIGVGNDATDTIRLQAPGTAGILHQIGATAYPIPHTTNTNGSVGGAGTPVYVEAGVIKAGTTLGASAYHPDSYFALASHGTHVTTATVKSALGTVSTTAKKFLKDTGDWTQVAWGDLTGVPSSFAPSAHDHNRLNSIGRLTTAAAIAYNPSASQGFKLVWNIYDSSSRTNDAANSPSFDAGVINIPWDWGGYNGQIAISNTLKDNTRMQIRSASHIDNGESANPRYTPNYGAWREVVTATKATKVGDTNKPVYISNTGQATAISYTIDKSVPSDAKFTDTTYTNGTGLSLSGTTFNHSNSVTAKSSYGSTATTASANGGTIKVTDVQYDAQGHITASTDRTITLSQTTYNFSGTSFTSGNSGTGTHAANSITSNGHWYYNSEGPASTLGAQSTDGALYSQAYSASWVGQIAQDYRDGQLFVRGRNNGTWKDWMAIPMFTTSTGGIGGTTTPIYIDTNGKIQTLSYTIAKSVPANAVFTDTNKYHKTGSWSGLTYTASAVNDADELKFTLPTGTTATTLAAGNHSHTLKIGNKSLSVNTSEQTWSLHDILKSSTNIGVDTTWDQYDPGVYYVASGATFTGTNNPENANTNNGITPYHYGQLIVSRAGNGGIAEFYISHHDSNSDSYGIHYRTGWNNTYVAKWSVLIDSHNYTQYTVKKDGTGASGTWGISITGTAAKATADASGNTITSTYATKAEIESLLAAADAMIFKGVINATNGLPNSHSAGDTYRVGAEGTYPIVDSNGRYCEEGTLIICITNGTTANPAHWTAVETNEDGAVIGPSSSKGNNIVTFSGNTGRIIQDSGKAFSTATPGSSSTDAQIPTAKAVWAAINALDANLNNTTPGAGKTLTAFSQTDGKVSATFGDISITKSQVSDFAHDHDAAYLKLNGSNNMTADVNIIAGDTDKFVNFWYNTNKTAGASWRIGELGSGSSDANYFVIQSGTSDSSKNAWHDTIQIGANTFNVYLPSTTASTSTTTGALKVAGGVGVAGQVTATRLAANGSNTSYNLYVNGTSYFNGNVTHNGIVYFKNDQSYYINKNAQGYLDKLQAGKIQLINNKVEFYTTNADVSQTSSGNSLCGDISATAAANTSVPATMSFNIVQGASLVNSNFIFNGDIIPQSNASYNLGSISNHWKNAYINNTIFVSAKAQSISSYSDSSISDNLAFSYISPGLISVNINGAIPPNGSGYYLINAGQQYARLYIQAIGQTDSIGQSVLELGNSIGSGTANNAYGTLHLYNTDTTSARYTATGWTGSGISNFTILGATSTAQNTTAWSTLILGNDKSVTTTDPHSQGLIRIYSKGTVYTDIQSQIATSGSHTVYLPKYGNDMYLTHVGSNEDVGSGKQPVYVAENGRITACNITVGDAYTPVYSNAGVLTATAPVQYNEFTIVSADTQVDLNNDAYTADTYVLTIVITSGEANINAPINWTSSTGKVRLSTTVAVSGDVSGYILTARGTSLVDLT